MKHLIASALAALAVLGVFWAGFSTGQTYALWSISKATFILDAEKHNGSI